MGENGDPLGLALDKLDALHFEQLCTDICAIALGLVGVRRRGLPRAPDRGVDIEGSWPGPAFPGQDTSTKWGASAQLRTDHSPDVGRLLEAFNRPDVAELQGLIFMTNCCIAQPSVEELRKRGGQLGVEVVLYDRDRILAAVRQQPDLLRRHFPFVCTTETLKGPSVRANLIAQQCRAVLTRVAASNLPGTYMIRNQARLSAFAITPRDIDERPWLREEARLMRQIVERGVGVHQILCPAVDLLAAVTDTGGVSGDMQTELLRPGTRGHCAERVAVLINYLTEILPRITRVDCHFVLTGGPVANRYVFGSEITISGHKTSGDTEYILSHITEHPGHIHAVSEEFDLIFEDAAEHLLGKEWDPDDAELAEELRGKVVERLQSLLDFLGAPPTEDDSTGESREQ